MSVGECALTHEPADNRDDDHDHRDDDRRDPDRDVDEVTEQTGDGEPSEPPRDRQDGSDTPPARRRYAERDSGNDNDNEHDDSDDGCRALPVGGDGRRERRGDVRDGSKGHPAEVQAGDDVDQDAVEPAIGRLPGADRSKVGDDERCEEQDDADHGRPDREELHAR